MRVLFSLPSPTVFHRAQSVGLEEDTDSCVSGGSPGFDGRRHGSDFVPSLPEHTGETRGIRLRQWGGGPQQTQALLTHLNAATRWQQKNKGRLEQSTHFFLLLCFFLKSSRCGWVMWCDVNTYFFCCLTGLTRAQLDCVLGPNLWDYSDLDNLRLHRHISSCSKCQDVKKKEKQKTLWRHCVIFLPGPIFSKFFSWSSLTRGILHALTNSTELDANKLFFWDLCCIVARNKTGTSLNIEPS